MVIHKTMQQCIDELRRSEHSAGMVTNWLEPLRADLESVTAERDELRSEIAHASVYAREQEEGWRRATFEVERLQTDLAKVRERFERACDLLARMQAHLERTGLARLGESCVDTVLPRLIAERDALRAE